MGSTNAGKTDAVRRRINKRLPLSGAGDAGVPHANYPAARAAKAIPGRQA